MQSLCILVIITLKNEVTVRQLADRHEKKKNEQQSTFKHQFFDRQKPARALICYDKLKHTCILCFLCLLKG